jgi:hypothetical protein
MIAAMESIGGYSGWNAPSRRAYPFAWNVKIHRFPDTARQLAEHVDSPLTPAWDSAWEKHCDSGGFFERICEDMAGQVEDYSTWPGDDSGEFKFSFAGRSGGWLVLESAYGWQMSGLDLDALADQSTEWGIDRSDWTFAEVRKLYKALMVMESDFASDKIQAEFAWHCAQARQQWEAERRDKIAELQAEATADRSTARRLLLELRGLRRLPGLDAFRESCDTLRSAIRNALADARDTRREALALADGEESDA